jgi:transposase, IS5 family
MIKLGRVSVPARHPTRLRRQYLSVPWPALCRLAEPSYPKPGNGRPPIGVERMLRLYFLQQWNPVIASHH